MPYDATDGKTQCQKVRDLYDRFLPVYKPFWDAMEIEGEFLSGDRYERDSGSHNRDRRLVQIRGQETQDTIRHVVAKLTEKPRSVEARPVDNMDDPDLAEIAVSLIDRDFGNPHIGFKREFYQCLTSACEQRLGVVWLDWDPDVKPFGARIFSWTQPNRVMWDPAWHPHHPKCEWMLRVKRIPVQSARTIYKADWLKPDKEAYGRSRQDSRLDRVSQHLPQYSQVKDDDKVTIWECWYKNDQTEKRSAKEASYQELDPGQRYMHCAECGYRSDSQKTLQDQGAIQGGLPDTLEPADEFSNPGGGCPTCGGGLERIDAKAVDRYELAYTKGRRLVVFAPFSPDPDDKPLYDGKWPIPTARSFPVLIVTRYVKPGFPMGPSDVTVMWDQQVASDQLATLAVQRVFEHRNYWVLPATGITNYKGERFGFRDDDYNVMYRDATVAQQYDTNIQQISGTGLDPGFNVAYGLVQNSLTRYRPQLDIGPAEDRSRDIPVGTIERQTAEAEVSTADFRRRINDELSIFYGIDWDYIRATLTYEEASRLRIDGIDLVLNLMGDSLPDYDFVVEESPDFTGLDEQKNKAFQAMIGLIGQAAQIGLPPEDLVEIFSDINNLPKSVVRKFEKMLQEAKDQAEQVQMGQMGDMGGGGLPPDFGGGQPEGHAIDQLMAAQGGGIGPPQVS